jgi:hypothetical protein
MQCLSQSDSIVHSIVLPLKKLLRLSTWPPFDEAPLGTAATLRLLSHLACFFSAVMNANEVVNGSEGSWDMCLKVHVNFGWVYENAETSL